MKKGFLAIEYAVLIAIIVAALIAMQVYIRKAISGRWREAADSFGFGMQYERGVTDITKVASRPRPPTYVDRFDFPSATRVNAGGKLTLNFSLAQTVDVIFTLYEGIWPVRTWRFKQMGAGEHTETITLRYDTPQRESISSGTYDLCINLNITNPCYSITIGS